MGDDELPTGDPAPIGDLGAADLVDGLVPVARVADEDEARDVARRLVERGIGASLRVAGPAAPGTGHKPGDVEVRVMPEERNRALAILGGDVGEAGEAGEVGAPPGSGAPGEGPARTALAGSAVPGHPERLPVPWKSVFAIWLAALVIIPLVAGLAAYFVLSR